MDNIPRQCEDAVCGLVFFSDKRQKLEGNREHVSLWKRKQKNMCYKPVYLA